MAMQSKSEELCSWKRVSIVLEGRYRYPSLELCCEEWVHRNRMAPQSSPLAHLSATSSYSREETRTRRLEHSRRSSETLFPQESSHSRLQVERLMLLVTRSMWCVLAPMHGFKPSA